MSENETPKVVELPKPSRLKRVKSTAITAGIYAIPVVLIGGSMYFSAKVTRTQLEIAKLGLETAKLNHSV